MLEEIKNIQSNKGDLRKFSILIGFIFFIIGCFLFFKEQASFKYFFTIGITLFLTGITIPVVLKPIYWMWMVFATILGWFMTRLILSILYYIVITPIGLILKLFGKEILDLKISNHETSYWNLRDSSKEKIQDYEKQF